MKFNVQKKGYNIAEVDNYVSQAEQTLSAQKERILNLKKKSAALEKEVESYSEKKDLIISALTEAVKKAEEIERQANQKYDLEIQRLRQFHAKWTDYYGKLLKKYPISLTKTDDFNRDMDRILRETEWDTDDSGEVSDAFDSFYKKEKARLAEKASGSGAEAVVEQSAAPAIKEKDGQERKETGLTPLERIKNYLDNGGEGAQKDRVFSGDTPSESGVFSLEEALHPKQDLAGIMKDLGLIEDL